jgi:TM2 domain-containing membrane protein YozV
MERPPIRSRVALVLLSFLFGYSGMDRFYMSCYLYGFVKLIIFLIALATGITGTWIPFGIAAILSFLLWMIDFFAVSVNAVLAKNRHPWGFCNKTRWMGKSDSNIARFLPFFAAMLAWVAFTAGLGTALVQSIHD